MVSSILDNSEPTDIPFQAPFPSATTDLKRWETSRRSTRKKRRFSTQLQLQLLKDDQHLTTTSTSTSSIIIIIIITTSIITIIIIIIIIILLLSTFMVSLLLSSLSGWFESWSYNSSVYYRWTRDVCYCLHPTVASSRTVPHKPNSRLAKSCYFTISTG